MKTFKVAGFGPDAFRKVSKNAVRVVFPVLEGGNAEFFKDFGAHVADRRNFDAVAYPRNGMAYFPAISKQYPMESVPEGVAFEIADALNAIYRMCPLPDGTFLEAEFVA